MSGWWNKLPGFQKSPPGLEWALWKRLPHILAWGTVLPLLLAVVWHWASPTNPTTAYVDDAYPLNDSDQPR